MMRTERKAANVMGGKTARACDGCLRKRARWFCAADDAFLCQACDASVHSANQLASRHERVRLEMASAKTHGLMKNSEDSPPAWHQGITRKARTPRHNNNKSILVQQKLNPLPLVPEIGSEEEGNMVPDESEDQLLYRVPVFDPFSAELCDIITSEGAEIAMENEEENMVVDVYGQAAAGGTCKLDNLPGFLPSDVDLAEFSADVESLLGRGFDDSPDIKDLGLLNCQDQEDDDVKLCLGDKVVKVKDEQEVEAIPAWHFNQAFDMKRESLDWKFDYRSPVDGDEEVEEKVVPIAETGMMNSAYKKYMKRNISLRLNYEAVITAWDSQASPWTTGSRPELNPDDSWPDCMGACPTDVHHLYGGIGGHKGGGDGGREARVLRYKEKRRTRLFSKKIRYEVRKLNAEKRPRLKGRFVKRTSFVGTAFPYLNK